MEGGDAYNIRRSSCLRVPCVCSHNHEALKSLRSIGLCYEQQVGSRMKGGKKTGRDGVKKKLGKRILNICFKI